jgi:hypothetical protein
MKTFCFTVAVMALLSMSACAPLASLHPLWDEGHAVLEPALAGSWISDENDEVFTITESGGNQYRLTYVDGDSASRYEVHAVRLENRLFLDVYPDKDTLEKRLEGELYVPYIPTHFFLKAVLEGNSLELALIDDDAFETKLERGDVAVPFVKGKDGLLLTAPTDQIQGLMVLIVDDPEVWSEPDLYHRCRDK